MNHQPFGRTFAGRSPAGSGWRFLRIAAGALGLAYVVALHIDLLAERIDSQTVFAPEVVFRWSAGAVLLAALGWLRYRGISLVRGRAALVVWTLVLLLHAMAVVPALENLAEQLGEAARFGFLGLLPGSLALAPLALLFAALALFGALAGTARPSLPPLFALDAAHQPALAAGFGLAVGCRPPPVSEIRSRAV